MKREDGQSTIEFILVSLFGIGFLLVFIQLAFNLTGGYLVHYATYMASRTYLVYDRGSNDMNIDIGGTRVKEWVEDVFKSYEVGRFGMDDENSELVINNNNALDYFFVGVHYRYQQPLSIFDYLGGDIKSDLRSESFLGKEPTRGECWRRVKKAMDSLDIPETLKKKYVTVFDNGC